MPTPATVFLSESNGVGEVVTDHITNINFGGSDVPNLVPAVHPVIRAQTSFTKWWRYKVQSLGTSSVIKNLTFWKASGAYVTGEDIHYTPFTTDWASNVYTTPVQGDRPFASTVPTADPGLRNWPARAATGAPNADLDFNITTAPVYSGYLAMVLVTTGSTPKGPVNQKAFIFQYDES